MVRGLDGSFLIPVSTVAACGFQGPSRRVGFDNFRWLLRGGNTSSHSEQSS